MVIGLMGGVGSGKSTILNYMQKKYNANIIQMDMVAKEIMQPGNVAYDKILKEFPTAFVDGFLDTEKLSKIVFCDKDALIRLNAITHPATIDETINRVKQSNSEYIIVESALLIGTGIEEICDELWFVFCDRKTRIERLINSRGYSRDKAESIILNQMSDDEFRTYSDVIIDNSYTEELTYEQIKKIMTK